MPKTSLIDDLRGMLQGQRLVLRLGWFEDPVAQAILGSYLAVDRAFEVDGATVAAGDGGAVVFEGRAVASVFGLPGLTVRGEVRVVSGRRALRLSLSGFPVTWTLAQTFPALAGSLADAFQYRNVAFTIDTEARKPTLAKLDLRYLGVRRQPAGFYKDLTLGLSLRADILYVGGAQRGPGLIVGDAPRTVEGAVGLIAGLPQMDLVSAAAPSNAMERFACPVNIEFATILVPPAAGETATTVEVATRITGGFEAPIGSTTLAVPLVCTVDDADETLLTFEGDPTAPFDMVTESLGALLPSGLATLLPPEVPGLRDIHLTRLRFTVDTDQRRVDSVLVGFTLDGNWSLLDGAFVIESLYLELAALGLAGPGSNALMVRGTTRLGDTELVVGISATDSPPRKVLFAELPAGKSISLNALISAIDPSVGSLPALKITALDVRADLTGGPLEITAAASSAWPLKVGGTTLPMTEVRFGLTRTAGVSTVTVRGTMSLGASSLYAQGSYGPSGWVISGGTSSKSTIGLRTLVTDLVALWESTIDLDAVPDLQITDLHVEVKPRAGEIQVRAKTADTATIGVCGATLRSTVNVSLALTKDKETGKKVVAVSLLGAIELGGQRFEIAVDHNRASDKVTGRWVATGREVLDWTALVRDLAVGSDDPIDLPSHIALDLALTSAEFTFDTNQGSLTLRATSRKLGTAAFRAARHEGKWRYALAVSLPSGTTFSRVSSELAAADGMRIESACLVVSSERWPEFQVTDMAVVGTRPVTLDRGVMLLAVVDLTKSKDKSAQSLADAANGATKLLFRAGLSTDGIFLEAALLGRLEVGTPPNVLTLSDAAVRMELGSMPGLELRGGIDFRIGTEPITATVRLKVSPTELAATFYAAALKDGLQMPGLRGIYLDDVGGMIGISPGAIKFGFMGSFHIGSERQIRGANKFAFQFAIVEKVPVPELLHVQIAELNLQTLIVAATDSPVTLPDPINAIEARNVLFYWCNPVTGAAIRLPDGNTALRGFAFSGAIRFLGWSAYAHLRIDQSAGVRGEIHMAPIDGLSVTGPDGRRFTFFALGGHGTGGVARDFATGQLVQLVPPGGPMVRLNGFESPYAVVSVDLTIFGLRRTVDAAISNDGLEVEVRLEFMDMLSMSLAIAVSSDGFRGSAQLDLDLTFDLPIGKIVAGLDSAGDALAFFGVPTDRARLDPKIDILHFAFRLTGQLLIQAGKKGFRMQVEAAFEWDGAHYGISFTVHAPPEKFEEIGEAIKDYVVKHCAQIFVDLGHQIVDTFEDLGDTVVKIEKEAEAWVMEQVQEAEQVVHTIEDGFVTAGLTIEAELEKLEEETQAALTRIQTELDAGVAYLDNKAKEIAAEAETFFRQVGGDAAALVDQLGRETEALGCQIWDDLNTIGAEGGRIVNEIAAGTTWLLQTIETETGKLLETIDQGLLYATGEIWKGFQTAMAAITAAFEQLWVELHRLAELLGMVFTQAGEQIFDGLLVVGDGFIQLGNQVIEFGHDFVDAWNTVADGTTDFFTGRDEASQKFAAFFEGRDEASRALVAAFTGRPT